MLTSGGMTTSSYRDLDVWVVSMDLVDQVLADVKAMPRVEFDLRRQIKRAVISIPSNVAEGWCRKKRSQAYQNHVSIAMGSHGALPTRSASRPAFALVRFGEAGKKCPPDKKCRAARISICPRLLRE
jgi:hypothetical protein